MLELFIAVLCEKFITLVFILLILYIIKDYRRTSILCFTPILCMSLRAI